MLPYLWELTSAFFALGAGKAKHDGDGSPAPLQPKTARFVLITDAILLFATLLGCACGVGTTGRSIGSNVFAAGCLIGAVEGLLKLGSLCKDKLKELAGERKGT